MREERKIRVLIVDDSAVMRKLIANLLAKDEDITVVGTAMDGVFALGKLDHLKPDVITLDVDMPRADGLSILRQIVAQFSIPVVMLSSLTVQGARTAIEALEIGAVEVVCKPGAAARIGEVAGELIAKVKAAARSRIVRSRESAVAPSAESKRERLRTSRREIGIVAVGASSGGPHALRQWLPQIPADFPCPIVLVQHLPETFTATFARWLDEICQLEVREAQTGMMAGPGMALLAPGDAHLKVRRRSAGAEALLDRETGPVNGHVPSVEVLFHSVAQEYGPQSAAVIMTGMGDDGADAIGEIKRSGGHTIAQNEESCLIFGMPKVAIRKGCIDQIVPLDRLAEYLIATVGLPVRAEVRSNAK
jgi:two-component system, chemotaxis family, protein-glutamate methylesterase/glutaminase